MQVSPDSGRHFGLLGATGVGVAAIVGGGILALAGIAFVSAGPSAILAFAFNGVIAAITAMSFAELATRFPESGGSYTFAKKVFSVETAFVVGWVVWFASIVAGVLYALGFGTFAALIVIEVVPGGAAADWITGKAMIVTLAMAATAAYTFRLTRSTGGGGQVATVGKVAVFLCIIGAGCWFLVRQPAGTVREQLTPFAPMGWTGIIAAMGYTFIALQGFDLIAAVGGEVRNPEKTIPRAMFLSLAIALAVYVPLMFLVATVGIEPAGYIVTEAIAHPSSIVVEAAERFMGPAGLWLVLVAGILAMLSALHANLLAASRMAFAMGRDRTLPSRLSEIQALRGTPDMAVYVTGATILLFLLLVQDVARAGAVASLIFLLSFAIVHLMAFLARRRRGVMPGQYASPLFPLAPLAGGFACICLALFQGFKVPSAGKLAVFWTGIGGLMYLVLFARRARIADARQEGLDPELALLRGKNPLVLVPIANPVNAAVMVEVATALAPPSFGRVLLLSVVAPPTSENAAPPEQAHAVLREALGAAFSAGAAPESLITISPRPWQEISRVARIHDCESVLLGYSSLPDQMVNTGLEQLVSHLDCDVAVLRAPEDWQLSSVRRVLVPIAGGGRHDELRARLLGSLARTRDCTVVLLHVIGTGVSKRAAARAKAGIAQFLRQEVHGGYDVKTVASDDVAVSIAAEAESCDLIILGVHRQGRRRKTFGAVTQEIARTTSCALIMISRRG